MEKKLRLNDMTGKDADNTNIVINQEEDNFNDLIALKAVDELLNIEKLKTITRINPNQVANLTKLYLFTEAYNAPFTTQLADTILQLQISLKGLGRQELVQLVQQRSDPIMPEKRFTSKDIFK